MKHLTGSGKSGRIGTWFIVVVAAALLLLAATMETAQACVNCTAGGKCSTCSWIYQFLYGKQKVSQSAFADETLGKSEINGKTVKATVLLGFKCQVVERAESVGNPTKKTYAQIIATLGRRMDSNSSTKSQIKQVCFEVEVKDSDKLLEGCPAAGVMVYLSNVWAEDEAVEQRITRIHQLIPLGMDIDAGAARLKEAGFIIAVEKHFPTADRDYYAITVLVRKQEDVPFFETVRYAWGMGGGRQMYVVIKADVTGKIIKVDRRGQKSKSGNP
ncbi:MAG: hypothetical protein NT031_13305 [Planctomycetota bacterium]|nr:hypothetical protein [Planctomycetota bacterium]